MATLLFIVIMPEIFFVFRRVFGLTDELTIVRGIVVSMYCWFLSPFLFGHFSWLIATIIMFFINIVINVLFLIANGNKRRTSTFIKIFDFLGGIIASLLKGFFLGIILLEEKLFKRNPGNPPWALKLRRHQPNREQFSFMLTSVFEPFLAQVKYRNSNFGNRSDYLTEKRMWNVIIFTSLLATLIWAAFIWKSGIRF